MSDTSQEEVKKSRAPRKRATRKRVVKKTRESSPAPQKAVAEKPTPTRKSPTPLAAKKRTNKTRRNQVLIALVIFICGLGGSAAIGFSDKGMIDVNQKITERNQKAQESGDTTAAIPVQNPKNNLPDGGLVGLGVGAEPPKPVEEVATSTASSTDETASTTDAGTEEASEGQIPLTEAEVNAQ